MRKMLLLLLALSVLSTPFAALAQDAEPPPADPPAEASDDAATDAPEASASVADGARYGGAEATHTINATARFNLLPDSVLGIWFDRHGSLWDDQSNMGFGLEYTWRKVDSFDVVIGVIWSDFSMPDSYWLEAGDNWDAADWTSNSLSTLAIEARIYGYYDFIKELGIYYGAGVWLGAILGEIRKESVAAGCALAAQGGQGDLNDCPHPGVSELEEDVPPVFGFVNVSLGLRAELEEMFVIKLEGGFQGNFYVGLSMGVQFF